MSAPPPPPPPPRFLCLRRAQADLEAAAEKVNSVESEEGMLAALTAEVGSKCKCLTLFRAGSPIKPQAEEPEGLTYAVSCFIPI